MRKTPEIEALLAERIMQRVIMDGNGRLSRVLVHYTLCQTGALERGHILPISAGMKRHELDYLAALQSFSRPAG